ncbi:DUF6445 family protein [Shewanella gaetbuli]
MTSHSNDNSPFVVNTPLNIKVEHIGLEQTPVIIIDDFAEDLSQLRDFANQSTFKLVDGSYYPGLRAPLPRPYVISVLDAIFQLIYDTYSIPTTLRLKPKNIVYSLITKNETDLDTMQCLPHFDTPEPYYFAILHYLQSAPHGGTGFFRHMPTQFERITAATMQSYFNLAQQHIDQHGAPAQGYMTQSNPHYQLYHHIEYRPNRLVVYPGNLLHSTIVNRQIDIDNNPQTGRLTGNIFINFE